MKGLTSAALAAVVAALLLVAPVLVAPATASAQLSASVGAGVANPLGDFGDDVDAGFTVRGQVGLNLLVAGVHAQVGYSRFSGVESGETGNVNMYHYGLGGRAGVGLAWFGATAARFSGDGEGSFGFIPEVGVGLGPLEAVADVRITGDRKWWALRGALRF